MTPSHQENLNKKNNYTTPTQYTQLNRGHNEQFPITTIKYNVPARWWFGDVVAISYCGNCNYRMGIFIHPNLWAGHYFLCASVTYCFHAA